MIIDHTPKKAKTYVTDSYMLKFIEQKLGIPQTYGNMEIEDDLPYFQHLYQHLKEIWYGMQVFNLMQPPSSKVDALIEKYTVEWNDRVWGSIWWDNSQKSKV